jgi:hypothetical protein
MAAIISALDNYTPSQIGEKGNIEYTWSNNISEKIVQLSFQLTRTDSNTMNNISLQTDEILTELTGSYRASLISRDNYIDNMSIMYRMVAHTRDIIDGKGEYSLAFMLLKVWNDHYPELAEFALRHFVLSPEENTRSHPYGSWKDIKYLYKQHNNSSLVKYGMTLMLEQIKKDSETTTVPSLAAKWVPREKTRFGDMFADLATTYFSNYINSATNEPARQRAVIKAKMDFRKIVSALNKKLDTVQIKQCSQRWAEIDPLIQTSITMHKQKNAFLNINKQGFERSILEDRVKCGNAFRNFAQKAFTGEIEVNGKRIGLNDFTKQALQLCDNRRELSDESTILNAQWNNNSNQTNSLGKVIAMVDVSGSMEGTPLHAAIALGIRVAEKSILGKRIMTFSAYPSWINLDGHDNFVDMVKIISNANWGMNTNFEAALHLILDAIISQKLNPDDVEDMVLAIFSDMQIDDADTNANATFYDSIEQKYADAGVRVWGKPYKLPHILFWNLRSTSGFPTLSTQRNCSMMSGFSPALLNIFCDEGLLSLQSCNPLKLLVNSLENNRYAILDAHIREKI